MQRWPLSGDGLGISIQELGLLLGHMKSYLRDTQPREHTGCTEDEGGIDTTLNSALGSWVYLKKLKGLNGQ